MEEQKLSVTFVNVGYGEAILLECPDTSRPGGAFTALIDGGSAEATEFSDRSSGRIRIEEYLARRGISRLDLAVSTHIHEDHICGLLRAAQIAPPDVLWQPLSPDFTVRCIRWMLPRLGRPRKANFCALSTTTPRCAG